MMKTILGALLFSLTTLYIFSDTQAVEAKALNYCQNANQSHCLEAIETPHSMSVTDIPPVGCAIPMAQIEKVWQAQK
jgi:hypothetical protein